MPPKKKTTAKPALRRTWDPADEKRFKQLVKSGLPTAEIAQTFKRSAASIRSKAQKLGLALKAKLKKGARK